MSIEENFTTIQISKEVHGLLEDRKIIQRESFNTVIKRLIVITETKNT